jgi:twinkle protein
VRPADLLAKLEANIMRGEDRGVSTGWANLDQFYTVKKGELCIITGVPSHGKSEFLDALMHNLALHHGWKFAMFSPENKPFERHLRKIIERHAGCSVRIEGDYGRPPTLMNGKKLSEGYQFAHEHFRWIDLAGESTTLGNMCEWFSHEIIENGIDGIVIDPWGDIEHKRPARMNETEYISFMLTQLREFARAMNVALWIVAHPRIMQRGKDGKFPMPSLWDISGSAHWRNRADVGLVVYREDLKKHELKVEVAKVRFKSTGKPGTAHFSYDYQSGRISPMFVEDHSGRGDQ